MREMRGKPSDLEVCEINKYKCVEKLRIGKLTFFLEKCVEKNAWRFFCKIWSKNLHTFLSKICYH